MKTWWGEGVRGQQSAERGWLPELLPSRQATSLSRIIVVSVDSDKLQRKKEHTQKKGSGIKFPTKSQCMIIRRAAAAGSISAAGKDK
jgi:hypothetical protein